MQDTERTLRGSLESTGDESGADWPSVPFSGLDDRVRYYFTGEDFPIYPVRMPDKFTHLSQPQYEAILEILDKFRTNKAVVLDAPTGSGKTVIAETVRQLLGFRGLYVCHSKTLQDQFFTDYPTSGLVKGRSNYIPQRKIKGVTCADCNRSEAGCSWCPDIQNCSYELAKRRAISNPIAVLNSTYYLTECNGPGRFSKRPFGILDEADTLEQELLRFVEIRVTPSMQKRLGLNPPAKVTKEEAWRDWVEYATGRVRGQRLNVESNEQDLQLIRRAKYVENLLSRLKLLSQGLENEDWIYTGTKSDGTDISFKPIVVDRLGKEYLWGHCGKFLVMSASIISAEIMMEDLGFEGEYSSVFMDSQFDVKNRQVKVIPIANMSKKANERDELLIGILRIAERHPSDRMLLHTVSYDLANWLLAKLTASGIQRPVLSYGSASERDSVVARYRRTSNAMLVAPSLDRGIDFKDDDCRVVIICKVPFPYLGDKQVSQRLYGKNGQTWYNVQTVRSIVQMTGRGTRHVNDYSVNYILDKQFGSLWSKAKNLFPKWWRDSIDWRDTLGGSH